MYNGQNGAYDDPEKTLPAIRLMAGQQYFFIAEGTHEIAAGRLADAQFYQNTSGDWVKGGGPHLHVNSLINWWAAVPGEAHVFTKQVTVSQTDWLRPRISDSYHDDNTGSLTLKVYRKADAQAPTVTVTGSESPAKEAGPVGQSFTFVRTGDLSVDLRVRYSLADSSATIVTDYTVANENYSNPADAVERYVKIKAGESSATVLFTPVTDAVPDENEYVTATVLGPESASDLQYFADGTWTIGIEDIPVVWVEKIQDGSEDRNTPGKVRIHRSGASNEATRVYFSVSGSATEGAPVPGSSNSVDDTDYYFSSNVTVQGGYHTVLIEGEYVDIELVTLNDSRYEEGTEDVWLTLEEDQSSQPMYVAAADLQEGEGASILAAGPATQPVLRNAKVDIKNLKLIANIPVIGNSATPPTKQVFQEEVARLNDESPAIRQKASDRLAYTLSLFPQELGPWMAEAIATAQQNGDLDLTVSLQAIVTQATHITSGIQVRVDANQNLQIHYGNGANASYFLVWVRLLNGSKSLNLQEPDLLLATMNGAARADGSLLLKHEVQQWADVALSFEAHASLQTPARIQIEIMRYVPGVMPDGNVAPVLDTTAAFEFNLLVIEEA